MKERQQRKEGLILRPSVEPKNQETVCRQAELEIEAAWRLERDRARNESRKSEIIVRGGACDDSWLYVPLRNCEAFVNPAGEQQN